MSRAAAGQPESIASPEPLCRKCQREPALPGQRWGRECFRDYRRGARARRRATEFPATIGQDESVEPTSVEPTPVEPARDRKGNGKAVDAEFAQPDLTALRLDDPRLAAVQGYWGSVAPEFPAWAFWKHAARAAAIHRGNLEQQAYFCVVSNLLE